MPASAYARQVLVDMTPLEPGGANGGAGLVAMSLLEHLAALARDCLFTFLSLSRAPSYVLRVAELPGRHGTGPSIARHLYHAA